MRFRSLSPRRRNRLQPLVAVVAALVAQAALIAVLLWFPAPAALSGAPARRAPVPAVTLTYIPLQRTPPSPVVAPLGRGLQRTTESATPGLDGLTLGGIDTASAPGASETSSAVTADEQPCGMFDSPFMRSRDTRLVVPPVSEMDSLDALRGHLTAAFAEAIARERAANAASDWTLGTGDARFGLSPGRLHLGRLVIPLPVSVRSLRDVDPRVRQQQSMLREVREQGERREHDGAVAAPRRP